jgi:hypothetical protein
MSWCSRITVDGVETLATRGIIRFAEGVEIRAAVRRYAGPLIWVRPLNEFRWVDRFRIATMRAFPEPRRLTASASVGLLPRVRSPHSGTIRPGPQRIITGQGGEFFYTPDHYQTFIPLN